MDLEYGKELTRYKGYNTFIEDMYVYFGNTDTILTGGSTGMQKAAQIIAQAKNSIGETTALSCFDFEHAGTEGFDAANICPHKPEEGCECHKSKPGILQKAAAEHELDLTHCAVIGDVGSTDMLLAAAVGAK